MLKYPDWVSPILMHFVTGWSIQVLNCAILTSERVAN